MVKKNTSKKIYIACPISKYINGNNFINNGLKLLIKDLLFLCRAYTVKVYSALKREKFGLKIMKDEVCTPLDYKAIKNADILIAIPEDSMGVAVEIGWASALGKEIFLILDSKYRFSPLITGIHTITKTCKIYYNSDLKYRRSRQKILKKINNFLANLFDK